MNNLIKIKCITIHLQNNILAILNNKYLKLLSHKYTKKFTSLLIEKV